MTQGLAVFLTSAKQLKRCSMQQADWLGIRLIGREDIFKRFDARRSKSISALTWSVPFPPKHPDEGFIRVFGGAGGIRTLDRALQPYNGLANRRLQPLGHSSVGADMPDTGASRKRPIARRRIPGDLAPGDTDDGGPASRKSQKRRPWEGPDRLATRITTGIRSRARVICATSVRKDRFGGVWNTCFMLRVRRPSVRVMTRRRGAPEVVPF